MRHHIVHRYLGFVYIKSFLQSAPWYSNPITLLQASIKMEKQKRGGLLLHEEVCGQGLDVFKSLDGHLVVGWLVHILFGNSN